MEHCSLLIVMDTCIDTRDILGKTHVLIRGTQEYLWYSRITKFLKLLDMRAQKSHNYKICTEK